MVDGTAVQTEVREATLDVAMNVDAPMVLHTWDVPVALPMGGLALRMHVVGGREIAMPVAARAKVLAVMPKVGEKATVVTPAAEAVEIHSKDDSRVVRLAVVIFANLTWLEDVAQAARRHSLARNSVDRVDRLRLPVTRDVRHSVADHHSPTHLSLRQEWGDHSQAGPDHRPSVVRKVGRLSIDHPGVDRTHVATVEMDPLKAVADRQQDRVMVTAEAHRVDHRTVVEIEDRDPMHETAVATDHLTAIADPNQVRVMVVAEAHRVARQTDVEIEVQDRMHEMVVVTGLHPELTDRDDGDQIVIGVTRPGADQMAMLHETATADPTVKRRSQPT